MILLKDKHIHNYHRRSNNILINNKFPIFCFGNRYTWHGQLLHKILFWMGSGAVSCLRPHPAIYPFKSSLKAEWISFQLRNCQRIQLKLLLRSGDMIDTFYVHWKKKWIHFDLKSWVTGGTKIRPGFRVIGEYLSQIDSILRVKLTRYWTFDSTL